MRHFLLRATTGIVLALGLGACGLFAASDDELTGGTKPDASVDGSGGDAGGTETGGWSGDTGGTGGTETGGTGGETGGTGGDTGGTGGETGGTGGGTGGTGGAGGDTGGTGGTALVPKEFGDLCSAVEPCESGLLCLQPEGFAVARCATLCCSSADCAAQAVCAGTTVGGTGCFPVTALSRPAPGLGYPGSACSGSGECRSASCVGNECKDVCCKHASCADGRACAWESGTSPGWYCSTGVVGTSGGQGATCGGDADCDGRNCFVYFTMSEMDRCMGACCKDSDCGSNAFCDYYQDGSALIRQCFPYQQMVLEPPGPLQACCTNVDCPSGKCEVTHQKVYRKSVNTYPVLGDPVPAMRCVP
jgi:hypothetical protein